MNRFEVARLHMLLATSAALALADCGVISKLQPAEPESHSRHMIPFKAPILEKDLQSSGTKLLGIPLKGKKR